MKNLILSLIAVFLVTVSCSYGEDYSHNNLNDSNLDGQWILVDLVSEYGEISTITSNDTTSVSYATVGIVYDMKMHLDANSKSFTSTGTYTIETITTYGENSKDTSITVATFPNSGTWKLFDEQLILTTNKEKLEYDVYLFADDALGIKRSYKNQTQLESSTTIVSDGQLNYTWVREEAEN